MSWLARMPRRVVKLISAAVKASTPKKLKGKKHAIARRVAQSTLLAMALAASQFDDEASAEKRRLFDSGLIDRLRMPLTRYHE